MITILFAQGRRAHDIERLRSNGLGRYVALCRRAEDGRWAAQDGSSRCELRTFDVQTVNSGDLRTFIDTLQTFVVNDGSALVHVVSNVDDYVVDIECASSTHCQCSLSLCAWCREKRVRARNVVVPTDSVDCPH